MCFDGGAHLTQNAKGRKVECERQNHQIYSRIADTGRSIGQGFESLSGSELFTRHVIYR